MEQNRQAPVSIREATPSDASQVAQLFAEMAEEVGGLTASLASLEATVRRLTSDPRFLLLLAEAVADETIATAGRAHRTAVGLCIVAVTPDLWTGKNSAEIRAMVVRSAWRRRNVGRRLFAAAVERATALDCAYLYLFTEPKNSVAQHLYRSCDMLRKEVSYFELML